MSFSSHMDGVYRLFCGCCGLAGGDPEPPYSQLRHDSVTPIRDPPLQQTNRHGANGQHSQMQQYLNQQQQHQQYPPYALQEQGFVNPVHELTRDEADGPNYQHSDSGTPRSGLEDEVEDENREREQLDNIVESTQHSIIAVGQTDVDGVIMMDTQYREKAYKQKVQKMATASSTTQLYEPVHEFQFEPTQTPIQVPLRYDEMSATIDKSPIERMPFACPDFQQMRLARTMGVKNAQFLVEHPDPRHAGKSPAMSSSAKHKITAVLDQVHEGVVGIEVEPRDLIVSMDF